MKTKKTKKKKENTVNLVVYVEDSIMKAKIFDNAWDAIMFADNLLANNPTKENSWPELIITDIKGGIIPLDCIEIEHST